VSRLALHVLVLGLGFELRNLGLALVVVLHSAGIGLGQLVSPKLGLALFGVLHILGLRL